MVVFVAIIFLRGDKAEESNLTLSSSSLGEIANPTT
jgi:hypothetical protein